MADTFAYDDDENIDSYDEDYEYANYDDQVDYTQIKEDAPEVNILKELFTWSPNLKIHDYATLMISITLCIAFQN